MLSRVQTLLLIRSEPKGMYLCKCTHPERFVGRDNRRFIIDWCDLDIHCPGSAVFSELRGIGYNSEVVLECLRVVVDIVDKLLLHLDQCRKDKTKDAMCSSVVTEYVVAGTDNVMLQL